LVVGAALFALGCGVRPPASEAAPAEQAPATARPGEDAPTPAPIAPPQGLPTPTDAIVLVTDPDVLTRLEADGLAVGPLVFGGGDATIASFAADPGYASVRRTLERDLARRIAADPDTGVGIRYRHRAFDAAWLSAPQTRYELVAVVNRLDRRPFDPDIERCGETRLIYRLAYATELEGRAVDSRLPMTVNVVFWQAGADCREVARRWLVPTGTTGPALATALRAGPLSPAALPSTHLKSVEIDMQTVRWPGVVHPSLGGHAEYELRVFRRPEGVHDGPLAPVPLENTPDVDRIRGDVGLRAELAAWVADNLDDLDAGVAVLPPSLSTDVAVSVTPRGLARLANRPYSQLLDPTELAALPLEGREHIGSPAALLRRLDESSCQGCHETRSVAGFHVVGQARDPDAVLDTVAVAISAHLRGDLPRREQYVRTVADGHAPDERRPLSDFEGERGYGAHCGLGDPGFSAWTCADGLSCAQLDDPQVGTCLPEGSRTAGDPCELGALTSRAVAHRDRVKGATITACDGGAVCNVNRMGFPTGMCTQRCGGLHEGEACGPIVDFTAFNNCVGKRRPFPRCIEEAAHPVGLRACDEAHRCRDDYVCARSPYGDDGVCLPPYFLFQLRVDGHVM
jgi:hypothetical protein